MKKTHIKKKKISKECWGLDYNFIKWLNQHLKVYLKDASKIVDLNYYKFAYKDKEYTQEEIIKRMIYLSDEAMTLDKWDNEYFVCVDELLDLWKIVFHTMWW